MAQVILEREHDINQDIYADDQTYAAVHVDQQHHDDIHDDDQPTMQTDPNDEHDPPLQPPTLPPEDDDFQYAHQQDKEQHPADEVEHVKYDQYYDHDQPHSYSPQEEPHHDTEVVHVEPMYENSDQEPAPDTDDEPRAHLPSQPDDEDPSLYTSYQPAPQKETFDDNSTNSHSPPPNLPVLSPATARPSGQHECIRAICGATQPPGNQWGCSPDGRLTLCTPCYGMYSAGILPLFQNIYGSLSINRTEGSCPMRITSFRLRPSSSSGKARRDLSRPIVTPLTDSPEDQALLSNEHALRNVQTKIRKRRRVPSRTPPPRTPPRKKPRSISGNYSLPSPEGYTLSNEQRRVPRSLSVGLGEGDGVYVKVEWSGDIRRFRIRADVLLEQFKREIRAVFGFKRGFLFSVTYQDDEDRFVRVASNEKLYKLFEAADPVSLIPLRIRLVA